MLDASELDAWLRLLETPGVSRESARRLLAAFGSPQAVVAAGTAARREVVEPDIAQALATAAGNHTQRLEICLQWLAAADEVPRQIITLGDTQYPALLLEAADPPLLLYLQGRAELLGSPSIAIVGSRNPTAQGRDNARAFARHMSLNGLAVVSGLALGIDGEAHEGALDGSSGTIAVVGTGLDRVYPAKHRQLAHRISKQGLLVSEFSLGTPPLPHNFPLRNRIIAGLSRGTLVVEAALQSGSLITARLAAEAGRDVFAIPGSIHAPQTRGCHLLIKQGAKLVDGVNDILEEFGASLHPAPPTSPPAGYTDGIENPSAQNALLDALGHDPVSLDALVARTGWPAASLNAQLLELEFEGLVARLPGQLFQRRGPLA